MNRKTFFRRSLQTLGAVTVLPLLGACDKDEALLLAEDTTTTGGSGDCAVTPSETAGPFPTKSPASLVQTDITADRTGVPLDITLTVQDAGMLCAALEEAVVDLWHCDKDGNYSEYGSTALQQQHFLRGRQTTNAAGQVAFRSIYPGWYRGRAPHLHLHLYAADGRSLLVTQVAFPEEVSDTVYTTAEGYVGRGTQDTANTQDGIFRDSLAYQLGRLSGEVATGYQLSHTIIVDA